MEYKECKGILNEWIDKIIEKSKSHIEKGWLTIPSVSVELQKGACLIITAFPTKNQLNVTFWWQKCPYERFYLLRQLEPLALDGAIPQEWDISLLEILQDPDEVAAEIKKHYEKEMEKIIKEVSNMIKANGHDLKDITNDIDNAFDGYVKVRDRITEEFKKLVKGIIDLLPEKLKQTEEFIISIPLQNAVSITSLRIMWPELNDGDMMWFTLQKHNKVYEIYVNITGMAVMRAEYDTLKAEFWRLEGAFPDKLLQFLTLLNIHKDKLMIEIKKEAEKQIQSKEV